MSRTVNTPDIGAQRRNNLAVTQSQTMNVNVSDLSYLRDQLTDLVEIVNEMLNEQDETEESEPEPEQSEDNMIESIHNLEDVVNKLCTLVASLDKQNVGSKIIGFGYQGGVNKIGSKLY